MFADVVHGANMSMVESGSGFGFATKAFQGLRVASEFGGKKFKSDRAMEANVFGFINDAHAASAEFLEDAEVRDGLADQ